MRIAMTLVAAALTVACGGKKDETPAAGSGSAGSGSATMAGSGSAMAGSGAGSGSAMAGSGSAAGSGAGSATAAGSGAGSGSGMSSAEAQAMAHQAGNCPSTVFGATTAAEWKTGWKYVIVHVTATDKDAIAAIQKRTDELIATKKKDHKPKGDHDQKGAHGGGVGLCPVHVPDGATAKAKHAKDGVTVTITPKDHAEELKTDIEARIQKAADYVKANIKPGDAGNHGGVGGGKNKEGSNHSGKGDGKGKERTSGSATKH